MAEPMTREGLALAIFRELASKTDSPIEKASDYETRKHATLNLLEDVLRVIDGENRPDKG